MVWLPVQRIPNGHHVSVFILWSGIHRIKISPRNTPKNSRIVTFEELFDEFTETGSEDRIVS